MALVSFECSLNQTVVLQQRQPNAGFCKINLIQCVCMSQWDSFQFLKQNDNKLVPEMRKLDLLVRNGFYGTNFSTRTSSQAHTSTLAQDRHTHTHAQDTHTSYLSITLFSFDKCILMQKMQRCCVLCEHVNP